MEKHLRLHHGTLLPVELGFKHRDFLLMPDGRNDIRYGKACLKKNLSRRIEMELNALLIF